MHWHEGLHQQIDAVQAQARQSQQQANHIFSLLEFVEVRQSFVTEFYSLEVDVI
jgi:hypothetical protein